MRTFFLLLTVVGSLASFTFTNMAMQDVARKSISTWRSIPYDLAVSGDTDLEAQVVEMRGIEKVEHTIMFDAIIGGSPASIAVPSTAPVLLPAEYVEGRAASNRDEIALTESVARAQALQVGDEVHVALSGDLERVGTYSVSGIIASLQGIARASFMTDEGTRKMIGQTDEYSTLLVRLVDPEYAIQVSNEIRTLVGDVAVSFSNPNLSFNQGTTIAEQLVSLTMILLVAVSAAALYMLFSLGQQERAYELGVLRALGFSQQRIISVLVVEGIFILLIGGFLSVVLLSGLSAALGLGEQQDLLMQSLPGGLGLLALGLLAGFLSAWRTAQRPIVAMFKG